MVATAPEPWTAQQPPEARHLPRHGRSELAVLALVREFAADPDSFDGSRLPWDVARRADSRPKLMDTVASAADPLDPDGWLTAGMLLRRTLGAGCPALLEWTMAIRTH